MLKINLRLVGFQGHKCHRIFSASLFTILLQFQQFVIWHNKFNDTGIVSITQRYLILRKLIVTIKYRL